MRVMRVLSSHYLAPMLTAVLLGGVAVDRALFHTAPADTEVYHARIREAAENLPTRVGPWVATEVPVPPGAIRILHPNVIVSRRFHDVQTGRQASFLIVQCRDARDLLGHYPPVCYRGQGWRLDEGQEKDWQIDGWTIEGMQYEFSSSRLDGDMFLLVDNFMVLSDGSTCRDMDGVTDAARDHRRKFYGAAQVQLLTDYSFTPAEREDLFRRLVRAHLPLLDAIREGKDNE
jgi:hypothetical protein